MVINGIKKIKYLSEGLLKDSKKIYIKHESDKVLSNFSPSR